MQQNQAAVEALYSATFVEDYLDTMENLPNELQRHLSTLRELDLLLNQDLLCSLDDWLEAFEKEPTSSGQRQILAKIQKGLISAQGIGDEKLAVAQALADAVENRARLLEHGARNLDFDDDDDDEEAEEEDEDEDLDYHVNQRGSGNNGNNVSVAVATASVSSSASSAAAAISSSVASSGAAAASAKQGGGGGGGNGRQLKRKSEDHKSEKPGKRPKKTSLPDKQSSSNRDDQDDDDSSSVNAKSSSVGGTKSRNSTGAHAAAAAGSGASSSGATSGAPGSSTSSAGASARKPASRKPGKKKPNQDNDSDHDVDPRALDIDPDEPTYCLCDQVSYGDMIGCDNDLCPIEWFHFQCVQLTNKPKGKWYCPKCRGDKPTNMKPKAQFLKELEKFNKEREEKTMKQN